MNAPVANSKTRKSYDGALSAKPGVPGSGGRPTPGGAQSKSVGSRRGWMHVQPACVNCPGVKPSAFAGAAVAPTATNAVSATSTAPRQTHLLIALLILPPFDPVSRNSPLRSDAQHAAAVVAHPERSEADPKSNRESADSEPADDAARA